MMMMMMMRVAAVTSVLWFEMLWRVGGKKNLPKMLSWRAGFLCCTSENRLYQSIDLFCTRACRKSLTSAASAAKPSTAAPRSTRTRGSTPATNLSFASSAAKVSTRKVRACMHVQRAADHQISCPFATLPNVADAWKGNEEYSFFSLAGTWTNGFLKAVLAHHIQDSGHHFNGFKHLGMHVFLNVCHF